MCGLGLLWRVARGSQTLADTKERSRQNERDLQEIQARLAALEARCNTNFNEVKSDWISLMTAVNCLEKHTGRPTTEWKCDGPAAE